MSVEYINNINKSVQKFVNNVEKRLRKEAANIRKIFGDDRREIKNQLFLVFEEVSLSQQSYMKSGKNPFFGYFFSLSFSRSVRKTHIINITKYDLNQILNSCQEYLTERTSDIENTSDYINDIIQCLIQTLEEHLICSGTTATLESESSIVPTSVSISSSETSSSETSSISTGASASQVNSPDNAVETLQISLDLDISVEISNGSISNIQLQRSSVRSLMNVNLDDDMITNQEDPSNGTDLMQLVNHDNDLNNNLYSLTECESNSENVKDLNNLEPMENQENHGIISKSEVHTTSDCEYDFHLAQVKKRLADDRINFMNEVIKEMEENAKKLKSLQIPVITPIASIERSQESTTDTDKKQIQNQISDRLKNNRAEIHQENCSNVRRLIHKYENLQDNKKK